MILVAPAGALRLRPLALLVLFFVLAAAWEPSAARAAEEGGEGVDWLRDWIPSVGVSAGITSRETKGSIGGGVSDFQAGAFGDVTVVEHGIRTRSTTSLVTTCIRGQDTPQNNALCEYFDDDSTSMDSFMPSGLGQLMGPALNPLPLRPRLLFSGGYGSPISNRVVASDGFKVVSFGQLGNEPKVRLELKGEPQGIWWVGGGLALQLPIERYRTWLKISANYSEEYIKASARIDAELGALATNKATQNLTIRSIAPSLGVEAEIARIGPMTVSISGDTMVSIALESQKATFTDDSGQSTLFAPDPSATRFGGPVIVSYEPDDISVFGGISIRFNWVGFER